MEAVAKVAISADFLTAFAALPRQIQGKVTEFINKFRNNPQSLGINYARLPDLRVGDGSIQFEIANSDMSKVHQWYKLKQRDLLSAGEQLPPLETISMEQYQQTGSLTEQDYINTASEEMKKCNKKYEGREKGEVETMMEKKEHVIKDETTSSYIDHLNDPDYIPITINRETLVDKSIVTTTMREHFADRGQFCCRGPSTWEKDGKEEHILMIPLKDVYEADEGKSYIAFLDKKHLPLVLKAGSGTPAMDYFGMTTSEFTNKFFQKIKPSDITADRLPSLAKSLAEKISVPLKQPSPPVKVR